MNTFHLSASPRGFGPHDLRFKATQSLISLKRAYTLLNLSLSLSMTMCSSAKTISMVQRAALALAFGCQTSERSISIKNLLERQAS